MRYVFGVVLAGLLVAGCQPVRVHPGETGPPTVSAEARQAKEAGWPVSIAHLSGIRDASNDITVRFTLTNVSDRTVQYLYLTAYLRDAKGDPVLDERSRSIYKELQYKGPVRPGEIRWGEKAEIPGAFRHREAATVHIRDLHVVLADGTETPPIRIDSHSLSVGPVTTLQP